MSAVLFGALAAFANAGQALISKELTLRAPARQLIGVLYAGNCLVLLPFAPFVAWVWSGQIVAPPASQQFAYTKNGLFINF